MYKKILIPLDNSPSDQTIIGHIQSMAKLMRAQIVLVHVADGYVARLQDQLNLADSQEIKDDQKYLQTRQKELEKAGFTVKAVLVQGEPADEILKLAGSEDCDLIAMATHGHKFVKDLVLGSVANNIRHRTDIPVLMIRSSFK